MYRKLQPDHIKDWEKPPQSGELLLEKGMNAHIKVASFFISVCIHVAIFVGIYFFEKEFLPKKEISPKKLLVSSVKLRSSSIVKQLPQAVAQTAPRIEERKEVFEEPPFPKEEKEIQKSEPIDAEDISEAPKKTVSQPEPVQKIETASISEKSKKPVSKSVSSSKSEPKKVASKGHSPVKKNTKSAPVSQKTGGTRNTQAKKQEEEVDAALLQKVLHNLDQSRSYASSSTSSTQKTSIAKRASSVGTLHADGVLGNIDPEGTCEYASTPEEVYIADLIKRLQLQIRLQEPGEVTVSLTLRRDGSVAHVAIVKKSKKSAEALKEKLFAIHFAPFGAGFFHEKEHAFLLRLTSDLHWSCG